MTASSFHRASMHWLVVLGAMAQAACGGGGGSDASQIVAKVNRQEISVHQVNFLMQRTPGIVAEQAEAAGRAILDHLVEQELAVQAALDLKLDREPQVMQALAAARREVLARAFAARVADPVSMPQASDVAAYYEARPALYAQRRIYSLQELVVQATPEQTEALRRKLKGVSRFGEMTDYLRSAGLLVRASQTTQPAEALAPPLLQRLATMEDGQAMMLAAPGGVRIVHLAASQAAPMAIEQARAGIERNLLAQRRQAAVEQRVDELRKAADVRFFGHFARPATAAAASEPAAPVEATSTDRAGSAPTIGGPVADADAMRRGLADLK